MKYYEEGNFLKLELSNEDIDFINGDVSWLYDVLHANDIYPVANAGYLNFYNGRFYRCNIDEAEAELMAGKEITLQIAYPTKEEIEKIEDFFSEGSLGTFLEDCQR